MIITSSNIMTKAQTSLMPFMKLCENNINYLSYFRIKQSFNTLFYKFET